MKNSVETKNLTLRIPSDLADDIDEIILNTEEYTNRPDFIISAIRFMDEWLFKEYYLKLDIVAVERKERSFTSSDKLSPREKEFAKISQEKYGGKLGWRTATSCGDSVTDAINYLWEEYNRYLGESELILVRLPRRSPSCLGFFHTVGGQPFNIQDYARISIVHYLKYIQTRNHLSGVMFQIQKLSVSYLPEEKIRDILSYKDDFLKYFGLVLERETKDKTVRK
ncbi:MAG: ribbon-helix-helix domain-containing protein [Lachnospiraceae bacterium]|nr:ribbon-helix-helix domain-containing protein [Lachnospiraceae bacterium]